MVSPWWATSRRRISRYGVREPEPPLPASLAGDVVPLAGAEVPTEGEADVRYAGQSFELTVDADATEKLETRFHAAHEGRYGYRMEDEPVELVNLRLVATVPVQKPALDEPGPSGDAGAGHRASNFDGEWREVPVLDRERLGKGSEVEGPAIVEFREATCVVRPGWRGAVDGVGNLVLERKDG